MYHVAPYVGAWIETWDLDRLFDIQKVAPYVGAWIETSDIIYDEFFKPSHPTWVRGLKRIITNEADKWFGRTLRGCVD